MQTSRLKSNFWRYGISLAVYALAAIFDSWLLRHLGLDFFSLPHLVINAVLILLATVVVVEASVRLGR